MKKNLLFLLIFSLPLFVAAQDPILVLSSTDIQEDFRADLSDLTLRLELKVDVINNSADTLKLKWERTVVQQPESWETQGCDNNACYLPMVSSNYDENLGLLEPFVLPPDSNFVFTLYLLPNGQEGNGDFQISFYQINQLDSLLTQVDFTASVSSSVTNTYSASELSNILLFPNPVINNFRITNDSDVSQVVVRNILGKRIKSFEAYSGASYGVFDLPRGIYLVSLLDRSNTVIKTIRMSKHSLRP